MDLKYRTLSNFAELVETGECKNFKGRLKVGVDLEQQYGSGSFGYFKSSNCRNFCPLPCHSGWRNRKLL